MASDEYALSLPSLYTTYTREGSDRAYQVGDGAPIAWPRAGLFGTDNSAAGAWPSGTQQRRFTARLHRNGALSPNVRLRAYA